MSAIEVHPFQRSDRDQLTALVNAHIAAVVPGISVSVNTVMSQLEREPSEGIVDPWVVERRTLVAVERQAIAAGALVHRFGSDERVSDDYRNAGDIRWLVFAPSSSVAADALIEACIETMGASGVERQHAGGDLPALASYGVSECWNRARLDQGERVEVTSTRSSRSVRTTPKRWYAGVDVGARRKGFHCALVDDVGRVLLARHATPAAVAEWLTGHLAALVAVDSPLAPATPGEKSRQCERQLVAADVCSIRYTPDRARLDANPAYYEWVEHGFELYSALVAASIDAIECFPTASWSRWSGPRGDRGRGAWTSAALATHRLHGLPVRMNQDERDAVGAALTARAHARGETERYGDIVVPKLSRRRRAGSTTTFVAA